MTLDQYLSFAGLKDGDIVLDLGVYAGLTSIVFSRTVGPNGRVFGFEADQTNFAAATTNIKLARRFGLPANVLVVPKAVWFHENGLEFSVERAMGSSAVSFVGRGRGSVVKIPTITLDAFCSEQGIDRIDFIKIEGAEVPVLETVAGSAISIPAASDHRATPHRRPDDHRSLLCDSQRCRILDIGCRSRWI